MWGSTRAEPAPNHRGHSIVSLCHTTSYDAFTGWLRLAEASRQSSVLGLQFDDVGRLWRDWSGGTAGPRDKDSPSSPGCAGLASFGAGELSAPRPRSGQAISVQRSARREVRLDAAVGVFTHLLQVAQVWLPLAQTSRQYSFCSALSCRFSVGSGRADVPSGCELIASFGGTYFSGFKDRGAAVWRTRGVVRRRLGPACSFTTGLGHSVPLVSSLINTRGALDRGTRAEHWFRE